MDIDEIVETFGFLEPGEERYRYLIDLGKQLEGLDDVHKTEDNRVHGCQSRVWMIAERDDATPPHLHIKADSDAFIVRGLIAIVLAVFSGKTADAIRATDHVAIFADLGLEQDLSMGRRNGLYSMVQRIQAMAAAAG